MSGTPAAVCSLHQRESTAQPSLTAECVASQAGTHVAEMRSPDSRLLMRLHPPAFAVDGTAATDPWLREPQSYRRAYAAQEWSAFPGRQFPMLGLVPHTSRSGSPSSPQPMCGDPSERSALPCSTFH